MPIVPSKKQRLEITQSFLQQKFHYDPNSGHLVRKPCASGGRFAKGGTIAGHHHRQGYVAVNIGPHGYLAHRLIWLYVTGEWPPRDVDHINLVKNDNRWCNLRLAEPHQNCANRRVRADSTSGVKGVYKKGHKWRATLSRHGKRYALGYFDTIEAASAAYAAATLAANGVFGRA